MRDHKWNHEGAPCPGAYDTAGINEKLIANLRDLSHTMRSLYEGRGSQTRILMLLDELGGGTTQRVLTERLGIQPGSASEVITKLEAAGLLCRTTNASDRRTADVSLTEAGRALAQEARQKRTDRHDQMFACLSEEEKAALLTLLEKVNTDWDQRFRNTPRPDRSEGPHRHRRHGPADRRREE